MGNFMDGIKAYEQQKKIMADIEMLKNNGAYGKFEAEDKAMLEYCKADVEATQAFVEQLGDSRYNTPKEAPKASEELVEETIVNTEIYRRARLAIVQSELLSGESRTAILEAQRKQVAYGLDKYPEPLNPNTWTIGETVEHIMDESIDRLHYLIMLRIKLEQSMVSGAFNDILEVRNNNSRIGTISKMISNTIEELNYLVNLVILTDRETEAAPNSSLRPSGRFNNDSIDAVAHAMRAIKINAKPAVSLKSLGEKMGIYNPNLSMAGADMDGDTVRVFTDDELEELAAKENVHPDND